MVEQQEFKPKMGELVYDSSRSLIGEVMDIRLGRVHLRPPKGGLEWAAKPEDLRRPTVSESLSPRIAEQNHKSRNGGLV